MQEKAVTATRQLAKRQMTWLRAAHHGANWFAVEDMQLFDRIQRFLESKIL
jgi:tRNA A37 N6-isopentenylltransferase MiaA